MEGERGDEAFVSAEANAVEGNLDLNTIKCILNRRILWQ